MVAAAAEAIAARHQPDAVRRHVGRRRRARRTAPATRDGESSGPFRVDADRRAVDDAVAAVRVADDVVVEPGLDRDLLVVRFLRVRAGADQPLLFAGDGHEHERRVELDAALGEHARQLHRQHRPAAVVVRAGRVDVVVLAGTLLRIGGLARRLGARTRHLGLAAGAARPGRGAGCPDPAAPRGGLAGAADCSPAVRRCSASRSGR